jgi:hypothetical protein
MRRGSYVTIALLWMLSMLLTAAWARAQVQRWTPLSEPVVVSGTDMGFRVNWMHGRTPVGKLLVRLNGEWVEARIGDPGDRRVLPGAPAPPVR